jgi:hypothetical protein
MTGIESESGAHGEENARGRPTLPVQIGVFGNDVYRPQFISIPADPLE